MLLYLPKASVRLWSTRRRRSRCSAKVETWGGSNPCSPKASRSASVKAVPLLRRGFRSRSRPLRLVRMTDFFSILWEGVCVSMGDLLYSGRRLPVSGWRMRSNASLPGARQVSMSAKKSKEKGSCLIHRIGEKHAPGCRLRHSLGRGGRALTSDTCRVTVKNDTVISSQGAETAF